jgi:glutamate dehydrogenase/leucine dehydrogenase
VVIPDILANAGGVVVSYFEWVQNLQCVQWSFEDVFNKLDTIITAAVDSTWNLSHSENTSLRTAAFMLAIQRVASALSNRFALAASDN